MAPSQTAHNAQGKAKTHSRLKQAKLSFGLTKRTSSTSTAGKAKKAPAPRLSRAVSDVSLELIDDPSSSSSSESDRELDVATIPASANLVRAAKALAIDVEEYKEDLAALESSVRLKKHWNGVQKRMGKPLVHADNQNKINHILRVFDNSYEYGPCVGVTRLERWERAKALNLNPPDEIRDILLSKQGVEDDVYKHTVFYGEV